VRINDPPPINVSRPDARGPVAGVAPSPTVTPQSPPAPAPQSTPQARAEAEVPIAPIERRQGARRGLERRKQQLTVTLNTRVGQRRISRRRAEDVNDVTSIDVEA